MNPQVRHAQRACEAAKARQAVVVFIDGSGQYAVVSYGKTKAECTAVKSLCNAIADAIDEGELPVPGEVVLGGRRPSERQREFDAIIEECELDEMSGYTDAVREATEIARYALEEWGKDRPVKATTSHYRAIARAAVKGDLRATRAAIRKAFQYAGLEEDSKWYSPKALAARNEKQ